MPATLSVGDPSPDAEVIGPAGPVRLSQLWAESPLILVFLRHFG